jgi:DNA-binding response OmpR family regulator
VVVVVVVVVVAIDVEEARAGVKSDGVSLVHTWRMSWNASSCWRACGIIVLDLMLPGLDGLSVLRRLRQGEGDALVLILTARDTVEDRVRSLRAGADDFLVKPFAVEELLARIQALVRRRHGQSSPRVLFGRLEIDTGRPRGDTRRPAGHVGLPRICPARIPGGAPGSGGHPIRHRGALSTTGRMELSSNAVGSTVCTLRRRIDHPGKPSLIETRRGHGYVLRSVPS